MCNATDCYSLLFNKEFFLLHLFVLQVKHVRLFKIHCNILVISAILVPYKLWYTRSAAEDFLTCGIVCALDTLSSVFQRHLARIELATLRFLVDLINVLIILDNAYCMLQVPCSASSSFFSYILCISKYYNWNVRNMLTDWYECKHVA